MATKKTNSSTLIAEVLDSIDFETEFRAMGVQFAAAAPNPAGWMHCHAMGREDRTPSASCKIEGEGAGRYKDFASGDCLRFFDFCETFGQFPTWKDALAHYAKQAGIRRKLPQSVSSRLKDRIRFSGPWEPILVHQLAKMYGVSPDTIRLTCGGKYGHYPKASLNSAPVVVWCGYGPSLLDDEPRGCVLQHALGRKLVIYQGEEKPPELRKRTTFGKSGLVGHHALKSWRKATRVWKVEGVSDLLVLQQLIPPELSDEHVVVTNSNGAAETALPVEIAPVFQGKEVAVIHDCDNPGQNGALNWLTALAPYAESVRNVVLPFSIAEKHGKDLRDWINDGNGYKALCDLFDKTKAEAKPEGAGDLTKHEQVLKRLGIVVLGHLEGTDTIVAFAESSSRTFEIRSIERYRYENLLLHCGDAIEQHVDPTDDPSDGMLTMPQVRRAMAAQAAKSVVNDSLIRGAGVWEAEGQLLLVQHGEVGIWDGRLRMERAAVVNGYPVDVGSGKRWFNIEVLADLLEQAKSHEWRANVMRETQAVFAQWDNWKHSQAPMLCAALIGATWLQTIWPARPIIAITGRTNTGKTALLDSVRNMFGEQMVVRSDADVTEAAIRNHMRHHACLLTLDEFEGTAKRRKVMEMLRVGTKGGVVARGSSDQRGKQYGLRHIPWTGAIEYKHQTAADRNRWIALELDSVDPKKPRDLLQRIPSREELLDLGTRILAVSITVWREAVAMASALRATPTEGLDPRVLEILGIPVGLWTAALGETQEYGVRLIAAIAAEFDDDDLESDEQELIDAILTSVVNLTGGQRLTVGQLLKQEVDPDDEIRDMRENPSAALARVGVRILGDTRTVGGVDRIFFYPAAVARQLLGGTRFEDMNVKQVLLRVSGANPDRQRIGTSNARGVSLPAEAFELRADTRSTIFS